MVDEWSKTQILVAIGPMQAQVKLGLCLCITFKMSVLSKMSRMILGQLGTQESIARRKDKFQTYCDSASVCVFGTNELLPPPRTTFAFRPGSVLTNCQVMSLVTKAASPISFSHSQSRCAVWAYVAPGVA